MKQGLKETHKFICQVCGKEGIPLPRKVSHKHKKDHTKHLYCIYCRVETPHTEIF